MGEIRKASKSLVAKHEGKRSLGIPTRKWYNNIKTGCEDVE
jgi:hypothetical protein